MSILATVLGVGLVGTTATVVMLALRNGGLKAEVVQADARMRGAEAQLKQVASLAEVDKSRHLAQIEALHADIKDLENDLEACSNPGDRRLRIQRLLSKARSPAG